MVSGKKVRTPKVHQFHIALSFIIPIAIMFAGYWGKGIYPGGPNTVLIFDMKSQYMPFFSSLRYICCPSSDSSLFLNMSGGMGNNFMGFAYYIFSPLTWITTLFPLEELPDALYIITLLRIGMCGCSFCCYLHYTYSDKRNRLAMLLLSCCYALMSYNVGYSINIMWLDAVFMLPWILTGIEKKLKEERSGLFVASIFLSIVLNYYISFMSGVFAIGYLFIRLSETNKFSIKRLVSFVIHASVGIGLSMPVLLPGIMGLSVGRMNEEAYPLTKLFRYNFIDVLKNLTSGRYSTVLDDGLPLIFCGTATIALVCIYFFKSKDCRTNKVRWIIYILFYLFSMCFIPLDRVMHGFQETTCFEVRYGYVFSCMLLLIAYRGVICLKDMIGDKTYKKYLKLLFAAFVLTELFMNASILISELNVELHYGTRVDYERILKSKRKLLDSIDDDSFYRISENTAYTYNDAAWLGYNGFGYFSSCYNLEVMNFLGRLGEDQSHHILRDRLRTPLEETLFGAKYKILYVDKMEEDNLIATEGLYSLYSDENSLSLGYMTQFKEKIVYPEFGGNAFENQNRVAKELSGITEDVFVELPLLKLTKEDMQDYMQYERFAVEISENAPVWAYFEMKDKDKMTSEQKELKADSKMIVNGSEVGGFIDSQIESAYVVYLGRYETGDILEFEIMSSKFRGEMHVCYLDEKAYERVITILSENQLDLSVHSNGYFRGSVNAGDGGELLLSLPFMNGWRIKVDGEYSDYGDYRSTLLLVPLSAGVHDVEIQYFSPGVVAGIIIALFSLIFGVVYSMLLAKSIDIEIQGDNH